MSVAFSDVRTSWLQPPHTAKIINLLGDDQGVAQFLRRVFLEFPAMFMNSAPFKTCDKRRTDDRLIFARQILVQQIDQFGRDTFLKPPAVVSSFKAVSSRVEFGNYFRTSPHEVPEPESWSPYQGHPNQNCAKSNSPEQSTRSRPSRCH